MGIGQVTGDFKRGERQLFARGLAAKLGCRCCFQLSDKVGARLRLKRLQQAVSGVVQQHELMERSVGELDATASGSGESSGRQKRG